MLWDWWVLLCPGEDRESVIGVPPACHCLSALPYRCTDEVSSHILVLREHKMKLNCAFHSTLSSSKLDVIALWVIVSYIIYQKQKLNNSSHEIRVSCCFVFVFSCATGTWIISACHGSQIASRDIFYISNFYVNSVLTVCKHFTLLRCEVT